MKEATRIGWRSSGGVCFLLINHRNLFFFSSSSVVGRHVLYSGRQLDLIDHFYSICVGW